MTSDIFDVAILAVILISAIIGFTRGFVREALSLATWIAASIIAFVFHQQLVTHIPLQLSELVLKIIAFSIIFFIVLLIGSIIGALVGKAISKIGLTGIDHVLGTVFGALRGVLILSLGVILTVSFFNYHEQDWWKNSQLIPYLTEAANWLRDFLVDVFDTYQKQHPV